MTRRALSGRPPTTTHAAIEEAAFVLFERDGFEATTMDAIATAVGIGRRTLFRYYPSKNDILWGQFDDSLQGFEHALGAMPEHLPLVEAVAGAVIRFNDFPPEAMAQHRRRMALLLGTPALLAHSELRYQAWREVVARYVATRLGVHPTDPEPVTLGRVSLALSLAAYELWLGDPDRDLASLFTQVYSVHARAYGAPAGQPG